MNKIKIRKFEDPNLWIYENVIGRGNKLQNNFTLNKELNEKAKEKLKLLLKDCKQYDNELKGIKCKRESITFNNLHVKKQIDVNTFFPNPFKKKKQVFNIKPFLCEQSKVASTAINNGSNAISNENISKKDEFLNNIYQNNTTDEKEIQNTLIRKLITKEQHKKLFLNNIKEQTEQKKKDILKVYSFFNNHINYYDQHLKKKYMDVVLQKDGHDQVEHNQVEHNQVELTNSENTINEHTINEHTINEHTINEKKKWKIVKETDYIKMEIDTVYPLTNKNMTSFDNNINNDIITCPIKNDDNNLKSNKLFNTVSILEKSEKNDINTVMNNNFVINMEEGNVKKELNIVINNDISDKRTNDNIHNITTHNYNTNDYINDNRSKYVINENKYDNNKYDNNKSDNNKYDNNKSDNNKYDNNKSDNNKSDNNKSDNNKSDNNKSDNNKSGNNKSGNNKSGSTNLMNEPIVDIEVIDVCTKKKDLNKYKTKSFNYNKIMDDNNINKTSNYKIETDKCKLDIAVDSDKYEYLKNEQLNKKEYSNLFKNEYNGFVDIKNNDIKNKDIKNKDIKNIDIKNIDIKKNIVDILNKDRSMNKNKLVYEHRLNEIKTKRNGLSEKQGMNEKCGMSEKRGISEKQGMNEKHNDNKQAIKKYLFDNLNVFEKMHNISLYNNMNNVSFPGDLAMNEFDSVSYILSNLKETKRNKNIADSVTNKGINIVSLYTEDNKEERKELINGKYENKMLVNTYGSNNNSSVINNEIVYNFKSNNIYITNDKTSSKEKLDLRNSQDKTINYDERSYKKNELNKYTHGYSSKNIKQGRIEQYEYIDSNNITVHLLSQHVGIEEEKIINVCKYILDNSYINKHTRIEKEVAQLICEEFEVLNKLKFSSINLKKRDPIVTILGHVDHGKTSLLDKFRNSNIVNSEVGGITQKLGAFEVKDKKSNKKIIFLDTPGHSVFKSIRRKCVECCDIIILVIALDDGIMSETIECLELAKKYNIPIIIAANKMDKYEFEHVDMYLDKLSKSLLSYDVITKLEKEKGEVSIVPISAKYNMNIEKLQNSILETSHNLNLQSDYGSLCSAYVLEKKVDTTKGKVLTIICKSGVLKTNTYILYGSIYTKIKRIYDSNGKIVKEVYPSELAQIVCSNNISFTDESIGYGDLIYEMSNLKNAQSVAKYKSKIRQYQRMQDYYLDMGNGIIGNGINSNGIIGSDMGDNGMGDNGMGNNGMIDNGMVDNSMVDNSMVDNSMVDNSMVDESSKQRNKKRAEKREEIQSAYATYYTTTGVSNDVSEDINYDHVEESGKGSNSSRSSVNDLSNEEKKKNKKKKKNEMIENKIELPQIHLIIRTCDEGSMEGIIEGINEYNKKEKKKNFCDINNFIDRNYINKKLLLNNDKYMENEKELFDKWKPFKIITKGIGSFSVNDIKYCSYVKPCFLFAFNVDIDKQVQQLIDHNANVNNTILRKHNIIYELFKDLDDIINYYFNLLYLFEPTARMIINKSGYYYLKKNKEKKKVMSVDIKEGTCNSTHTYNVIRNKQIIHKNLSILSMQKNKQSTNELSKGCTTNAIIFNTPSEDFQIGDEIVAYKKVVRPPLFNKIKTFDLVY
ncbi:translation initiation factor IF-2, putative [Hepatocystis sp. ex Piliocolobus tephrosceles]|nr:translation initiation factor IF-2, putative [Hepatocystis sp. ex Piliocolobus tephrosceles]